MIASGGTDHLLRPAFQQGRMKECIGMSAGVGKSYRHLTTLCIGKPHFSLWQVVKRTNTFNRLLSALSENVVDLVIIS